MARTKTYYDHVLTDAAREGLVRERLIAAAKNPNVRIGKVAPVIVSIGDGSFETDRRINGTVDKILASREFADPVV